MGCGMFMLMGPHPSIHFYLGDCRVKAEINVHLNFCFGMLVQILWQAYKELHHVLSGSNLSVPKIAFSLSHIPLFVIFLLFIAILPNTMVLL